MKWEWDARQKERGGATRSKVAAKVGLTSIYEGEKCSLQVKKSDICIFSSPLHRFTSSKDFFSTQRSRPNFFGVAGSKSEFTLAAKLLGPKKAFSRAPTPIKVLLP